MTTTCIEVTKIEYENCMKLDILLLFAFTKSVFCASQ